VRKALGKRGAKRRKKKRPSKIPQDRVFRTFAPHTSGNIHGRRKKDKELRKKRGRKLGKCKRRYVTNFKKPKNRVLWGGVNRLWEREKHNGEGPDQNFGPQKIARNASITRFGPLGGDFREKNKNLRQTGSEGYKGNAGSGLDLMKG